MDFSEVASDMKALQPPSAYAEGYAKARLYDQEAADSYIRHTAIGDPELDPVMEELSSLPRDDLQRFIGAGIEQRDEVLRIAPQPLRDFFNNLAEPPWLDYEAFRPGRRSFHANVNLMLVAFVTGGVGGRLFDAYRQGRSVLPGGWRQPKGASSRITATCWIFFTPAA